MEAFLHVLFEAKLAELHIPGASIVVVQDGQNSGGVWDAGTANIIVYNGKVLPRAKGFSPAYLGFRCVKGP